MKRIVPERLTLVKIRLPNLIYPECAAHFNCKSVEQIDTDRPVIMCEDGSVVSLEGGKRMLTERKGSIEYPSPPPRAEIGAILTETGIRILTEDSAPIMKE